MSEAALIATQRDDALKVTRKLQDSKAASVRSIANWTTRTVRKFDWVGTAFVLLIAAGAVVNYRTGLLAESPLWSVGVATLLGLFGVYHGVMNALERPKIGLVSILNWLARTLFKHRLANAQLSDMIIFECIEYKNGRVIVPTKAIRQLD
jgi:hypothetical protein